MLLQNPVVALSVELFFASLAIAAARIVLKTVSRVPVGAVERKMAKKVKAGANPPQEFLTEA